jgi:hypothetical protein
MFGDWFIYNDDQPYGTDKVCMECAEGWLMEQADLDASDEEGHLTRRDEEWERILRAAGGQGGATQPGEAHGAAPMAPTASSLARSVKEERVSDVASLVKREPRYGGAGPCGPESWRNTAGSVKQELGPNLAGLVKQEAGRSSAGLVKQEPGHSLAGSVKQGPFSGLAGPMEREPGHSSAGLVKQEPFPGLAGPVKGETGSTVAGLVKREPGPHGAGLVKRARRS